MIEVNQEETKNVGKTFLSLTEARMYELKNTLKKIQYEIDGCKGNAYWSKLLRDRYDWTLSTYLINQEINEELSKRFNTIH